MLTGIVAFSFGAPHTIRSNRWIANIVLEESRERSNAPIFTQADIQFQEGAGIDVEYVEEKPGNPPPTLRIARLVVRMAVRRGIDRLVVAAAKPHLRRCMRDVRMAVREARASIEVVASVKIERYLENEWFDPNGTQPRAASKKEWDKRERILKLMPFFVYKRLAS